MCLFGREVPVILLFTWVILLPAAASSHQGVQRRQVLLPLGRVSPGCMRTFFGLEDSQRICMRRLGENIDIDRANSTYSTIRQAIRIELTEDQLDFVCGSPTCQRTFVTVIEACEVCPRVCVCNE